MRYWGRNLQGKITVKESRAGRKFYDQIVLEKDKAGVEFSRLKASKEGSSKHERPPALSVIVGDLFDGWIAGRFLRRENSIVRMLLKNLKSPKLMKFKKKLTRSKKEAQDKKELLELEIEKPSRLAPLF